MYVGESRLAPLPGRDPHHIVTGRGESRVGAGNVRIGDLHVRGAAHERPSCRQVLPAHCADTRRKIGFDSGPDNTVRRADDDRRNRRRAAGIAHGPLNHTRGRLTFPGQFQAQLVGRDGLERERVECILFERQNTVVAALDFNPGPAVPAHQPRRLRHADAAIVVVPVDAHSVDMHRPSPGILNPLRAPLRPIAVGAVRRIARRTRRRAILNGSQRLVARHVRGGNLRRNGEISLLTPRWRFAGRHGERKRGDQYPDEGFHKTFLDRTTSEHRSSKMLSFRAHLGKGCASSKESSGFSKMRTFDKPCASSKSHAHLRTRASPWTRCR